MKRVATSAALLLGFLPGLAVPVRAGEPVFTEKDAIAQLAAATKQALAQIRADCKAATKGFDSAAAEFGDEIVVGEIEPAVTTLLEAWTATAAALRETVDLSGQELAGIARTALESLDAVAELNGHFPADFCVGSGGRLDDFEAGWRKELAKSQKALAKSLVKARKAAAKQGVAFDFVAQPLDFTVGVEIRPGFAFFVVESGLCIDLAVAVSRLDAEADAIIGIAGTGVLQVNLQWKLLDIVSELDAGPIEPSFGTARWQTLVGDGPLPEQSYMLSAALGTDGPEEMRAWVGIAAR